MNASTVDDELRALDDEQMDVDMERHRVGPNVWFWPGKQLTQATSRAWGVRFTRC